MICSRDEVGQVLNHRSGAGSHPPLFFPTCTLQDRAQRIDFRGRPVGEILDYSLIGPSTPAAHLPTEQRIACRLYSTDSGSDARDKRSRCVLLIRLFQEAPRGSVRRGPTAVSNDFARVPAEVRDRGGLPTVLGRLPLARWLLCALVVESGRRTSW